MGAQFVSGEKAQYTFYEETRRPALIRNKIREHKRRPQTVGRIRRRRLEIREHGRSNTMWQRFTERARKVVFYAQEEAGRLGENYVSTEHLLLGLVRENDSVAARILDRIGVSLGRIRSEIERQVARGDGRLGQDMQLTPRAKRVIDLAYDEARQLNNNYIGTEHLLLGLIREGEGLAGRVLSKLGVDLERTRREVMHLQEGGGESGRRRRQPAARPRRARRPWTSSAAT